MKYAKTFVVIICLLMTASALISCNSAITTSEESAIVEEVEIAGHTITEYEMTTASDAVVAEGALSEGALPADTLSESSLSVGSPPEGASSSGVLSSGSSSEGALSSGSPSDAGIFGAPDDLTQSANEAVPQRDGAQSSNDGAMLSATTAGKEPLATSETPKRKNIFVIVKVMGGGYWAVLQAGAIDAGRDADANVIITGVPDVARFYDQITLLLNAVIANADAIVIAVADADALAPAVSAVYNAGIPIILIETMAETDDYSMSFTMDNIAAGRTAAAELLRLLKEKGVQEDKRGTIAVQIASTSAEAIISRNAGFKERWDANAPTNWEVMWKKMSVNDGDISKAVSIGRDMLATESDLIGLYAQDNLSTVGFATALLEADRTDVAMVGFDLSLEMERIIRSGEFAVSTLLQNQYFLGYDGVMAALDLANGGAIPAQKDIDIGVTVANASNIDSEEVHIAAFGGR